MKKNTKKSISFWSTNKPERIYNQLILKSNYSVVNFLMKTSLNKIILINQ